MIPTHTLTASLALAGLHIWVALAWGVLCTCVTTCLVLPGIVIVYRGHRVNMRR